MALASRSTSGYRRRKYAIALFACIYLFMVWAPPVANVSSGEVFPFFGWTLFSRTPDYRNEERGVIAHAINGKAVADVRYLIPNIDVGRSQKVLYRTTRICLRQPPACDEAVQQLLYPVVKELANSDDLEFSIVLLRASLHEVGAGIDDLAAGKTRRMDFFRPRGTIGRWRTKGQGRVPDAAPLPVGTAMWDAAERRTQQAEPIARSRFAVFLHGGSLIYLNEACTEKDMATRFFLHVHPKNAADLPNHRRRFGFDNLNFHFFDHFFKAGARCMVVVPLPDYEFSQIETGQFLSGAGRVWEVAFDIPEAAPGVRS